MKNLKLDFVTRFQLTGILAQAEGPLGKIAPLFKVLDRIRLTEDEVNKLTVENNPNGQGAIYTSPQNEPDFGKLSVILED